MCPDYRDDLTSVNKLLSILIHKLGVLNKEMWFKQMYSTVLGLNTLEDNLWLQV